MLGVVSSYSTRIIKITPWSKEFIEKLSRRSSSSTIDRSVRLSDTSIKAKKTGGFFKALADIQPAPIHYNRAVKKLKKEVRLDSSIKNVRLAHRKLAAQSMDVFGKALTVPITELLEVYTKRVKSLHPYEATIMNLTVTARAKAGQPLLKDVLVKLKALRVTTSMMAKDYAKQGKNAETTIDAKRILEEGFAALELVYANAPEALALDELLQLQKA